MFEAQVSPKALSHAVHYHERSEWYHALAYYPNRYQILL